MGLGGEGYVWEDDKLDGDVWSGRHKCILVRSYNINAAGAVGEDLGMEPGRRAVG